MPSIMHICNYFTNFVYSKSHNLNLMKKYLIPIIALLYAIPNSNAQSRLYPNEFDLSDVVITDGPLKHAMDKNVEFAVRIIGDVANAAVLPVKKGMPEDTRKELDKYFHREEKAEKTHEKK